jgi:hypothetical protein
MQNDTAPAQWDGRPESLNAAIDKAGRDFLENTTGGTYDQWRHVRAEAAIRLISAEHHQRTLAASAAAWIAAVDLAKARVRGWWPVNGERIAADLATLEPPSDAAAALAEVVRRAKEEERRNERERIATQHDDAAHFLSGPDRGDEANVQAAVRRVKADWHREHAAAIRARSEGEGA